MNVIMQHEFSLLTRFLPKDQQKAQAKLFGLKRKK